MVRTALVPALACGVVLALAGCGGEAGGPPVALPPSGIAYRALDAAHRLRVAEACRDRAAARASGVAARQLRAVDPAALRGELDDAFTIIPEQRHSVAAVCAERLPFVTPGLRVAFAGAKPDGEGRVSYETTSDKPLTIRGRVSPSPRAGHVVARREVGSPRRYTAGIGRDGRFVFAHLHLRKIADNTFTLTIEAPPNAALKVHFSAICLDCLAGAPPATAGS
jgi:hypothetical protein